MLATAGGVPARGPRLALPSLHSCRPTFSRSPSLQTSPTATSAHSPFRHPVEHFTWARWTWDIARLQRDIDSLAIKPKRCVLERGFVESFATQVLCLDKAAGRDQQPCSLLMAVRVADAFKLPLAALDEPLILLSTPKGKGLLRLEGHEGPDHVLADGSHRLARAFFADRASLDAYVLNIAQSRKYLLE